MTKAVLDTNVLISALLFSESTPAFLIRRGMVSEFEIILSDTILPEFTEAVLRRKFSVRYGVTEDKARRFIRAIVGRSSLVIANGVRVQLSRDSHDDHVLTTAFVANADFIVTGDKDLLILKHYDKCAIVTPTNFLSILSL